jgi:DNA-binding NarL/FixJ family response regulator
MKVLIAEEDPKLRYAIQVLAQEQSGWTVAGVVDSMEALADLVTLIHPDMVIMDMDLPGISYRKIEQSIEAHVEKIVCLVSLPINHTSLSTGVLPKRIWISKTESPENLVDIFKSFREKE